MSGEMIELIILPDDELSRLETRFGPAVRRMGAWNSDGVFGYCSVSISIVEMVANESNDPAVALAASRLRSSGDRTSLFVDLLVTFGSCLIEQIASTYRACAVDLLPNSTEAEQRTVVDWQAV